MSPASARTRSTIGAYGLPAISAVAPLAVTTAASKAPAPGSRALCARIGRVVVRGDEPGPRGRPGSRGQPPVVEVEVEADDDRVDPFGADRTSIASAPVRVTASATPAPPQTSTRSPVPPARPPPSASRHHAVGVDAVRAELGRHLGPVGSVVVGDEPRRPRRRHAGRPRRPPRPRWAPRPARPRRRDRAPRPWRCMLTRTAGPAPTGRAAAEGLLSLRRAPLPALPRCALRPRAGRPGRRHRPALRRDLPADRAALAARHPASVVVIDLPVDGEDVYSDGAVTSRQWIADGTLRRDDEPSFYVYRMTHPTRRVAPGTRPACSVRSISPGRVRARSSPTSSRPRRPRATG